MLDESTASVGGAAFWRVMDTSELTRRDGDVGGKRTSKEQ
jgi:hypothetical protein